MRFRLDHVAEDSTLVSRVIDLDDLSVEQAASLARHAVYDPYPDELLIGALLAHVRLLAGDKALDSFRRYEEPGGATVEDLIGYYERVRQQPSVWAAARSLIWTHLQQVEKSDSDMALEFE